LLLPTLGWRAACASRCADICATNKKHACKCVQACAQRTKDTTVSVLSAAVISVCLPRKTSEKKGRKAVYMQRILNANEALLCTWR